MVHVLKCHVHILIADASSRSNKDKSETPKFGLPRVYDRSYRIGFSVVPPDLAYKLRRLQDSRRDEGREESLLTTDHLTEFRTVLRHYVNFMQKRKVRLTCKERGRGGVEGKGEIRRKREGRWAG